MRKHFILFCEELGDEIHKFGREIISHQCRGEASVLFRFVPLIEPIEPWLKSRDGTSGYDEYGKQKEYGCNNEELSFHRRFSEVEGRRCRHPTTLSSGAKRRTTSK
jgi:hypothetical protein